MNHSDPDLWIEDDIDEAKEPTWVNPVKLNRAYKMLRFIMQPLPRKIIDLLGENPQGLTVTQIYVALRIEQCIISQHLAPLRRDKLVRAYRRGKFVEYTLNKERIVGIRKSIDRFLEWEKYFNEIRKHAI